MNISELNGLSYVSLIFEDIIDEEYDGECHDKFNDNFVTVNFTFNQRELSKYKLFYPDADIVDQYCFEINDTEWVRIQVSNSLIITMFEVDGQCIIPFTIWLSIVNRLPTRLKGNSINDIKMFSEHFSTDTESHNKIIEWHREKHIDDHNDRMEILNDYLKIDI